MTEPGAAGPPSAEQRLTALIDRLLAAAEAAVDARNWDEARAMIDDVVAVAPDDARAAELRKRLAAAGDTPTGQRALVTIMFSDLVDSTPLAEEAEPEVVRDVFALYRAKAQSAVEQFGGHIVKFLGDGIVAAFGYPDSHEDDARRTVLAGLALLDAISDLRLTATNRHAGELQVRVGIHTGVVVVADLGLGTARERDAIVGVTPNLAARLQSEAEPGMVVVSDVTHQLIERDFEVATLGLRQLKGITRPVEIFAVNSRRHVGEQLEHALLNRGTLVARQAARAQIWESWQAAEAAESTPAVLLRGEAGIGKSRLVADVRALARSAGADVLEMGCLPYYSNSALWPVAAMLERLLDLRSEDDVEQRLAALVDHLTGAGIEPGVAVPLIGPLVGVTNHADYPAPELDPTALRQHTLGLLADLIGRTRNAGPRLVIAEDLHWADPSTLELVGALAQRPSASVLTIMTSRTELTSPGLEAATEIVLGRLEPVDAARLIDDLTGSGAMEDETRKSIIERGEGIPLFIEELTRAALEHPDAASFPLRLQELLAARINAPTIDLRLVQLAATLGSVFDQRDLASLVEGDVDLAARLEALVEAEIIERTGHPDGTEFRFRHALMRDAAYETQVLETRKQRHHDVAKALAREGESAVVAHHFDLAGDFVDAVQYYAAAAQAAQQRGAHQEATQLTTRGLELVTEWPEAPTRDTTELTLRMLRSLSVSSVRGYAAPEVLEDFRRAEALSENMGSGPELMPALIAIWAYWLVNGQVPTARHLADRLIRMVDSDNGAWFAPEVHSCVGFQAVYEGDLVSAKRSFEVAFGGYDARAPEAMVSEFWPLPNDAVAVSAIGMAVAATLSGDSTAAAHWEERAVERCEAVPFPRGPFTLAFVKTYLAWLRSLNGDRASAEEISAEVIEIGQRYGYAYWLALGALYHRATRPDLAELEGAIATLQAIGHEAFRASYLNYLAEIHEERGDLDAAMETLEEGLLVANKSGELVHLPELHRHRARIMLAKGAAPEALADLQQALRLTVDGGAALLALRAAIDLGGLPESVRPTDWREVVAAQRSAVPADSIYPEVARAAELLG